MESRQRRTTTVVVLALALVQFAWGEPERAVVPIEYHIASQPLAQALNAWAQQSGLQLIWPAVNEAARTRSRALYGRYQPMQALTLLLQDSGLRYSVLKEGTVTLSDSSAVAPTAVPVNAARP